MINLIGEVPRAVAIWLACGGLYEERAVIKCFDVGVVEGVDIDGKTAGMLREIVSGSDVTVAEARRVVVAWLHSLLRLLQCQLNQESKKNEIFLANYS